MAKKNLMENYFVRNGHCYCFQIKGDFAFQTRREQ